MALSWEGPVSDSGPVTSSSLPMVRLIGSALAAMGAKAMASPAARAAPASVLRIISCLPCFTWLEPLNECSSGSCEPSCGHDPFGAGPDIGIEEHQPAMQARAIPATGFDILADGEAQDGIAETVIGRKGEALDAAEPRVAAKDELPQPVLVAGLALPGAVESGLVAIGLDPPDAAALEMEAKAAMVEPAIDIQPISHGRIAEAVSERDDALDGIEQRNGAQRPAGYLLLPVAGRAGGGRIRPRGIPVIDMEAGAGAESQI